MEEGRIQSDRLVLAPLSADVKPVHVVLDRKRQRVSLNPLDAHSRSEEAGEITSLRNLLSSTFRVLPRSFSWSPTPATLTRIHSIPDMMILSRRTD